MALAAFRTSFRFLSRSVFATNFESFEIKGKAPGFSLSVPEMIDTGGLVGESFSCMLDTAELVFEQVDLSSVEMLLALEESETTPTTPDDDGFASATTLFLGGSVRRGDDCRSRDFWHTILRQNSGWSRRNKG